LVTALLFAITPELIGKPAEELKILTESVKNPKPGGENNNEK